MLLEHIRGASELENYFKTRESHLTANVTTYETMWSLFVPGQKIYAKPFLNMPQVFVVESPPTIWERDRRLPLFIEMDCWCYDWSGKEIVKVWYWIRFERFRGTKAINELVAYPTKYYKDENPKAEIKNEEDLFYTLVKRGVQYDQIVRGPKGSAQQHEYDGEALADRRNIIKQSRSNEVGQIMYRK